MTIRKAEKNPVAGVRTFFVRRSPDKDEHTVVEIKRDGTTTYYCNCGDFFYRKLPFIHTNLFSNCAHASAVIEAIGGGK